MCSSLSLRSPSKHIVLKLTSGTRRGSQSVLNLVGSSLMAEQNFSHTPRAPVSLFLWADLKASASWLLATLGLLWTRWGGENKCCRGPGHYPERVLLQALALYRCRTLDVAVAFCALQRQLCDLKASFASIPGLTC